MKILAVLTNSTGATLEEFKLYEEAEAKMVWELYAAGLIQEVYSCADRACAVIMLKCQDPLQAEQFLQRLPTVKAGLLQYELMALGCLPKLSKLFAQQHLPLPQWWTN